jgi:DNA polymerase-3 subunit beta
MSGELFEIKDDKFTVVALDGHRISIRNVDLKVNSGSIKAIVPGKALVEISKIVTGGIEDMVNIYFTENNILFEFGETKVLSRLIEGEYFKIVQMMSVDHKIKVMVNRQELISAVDRSTLLIKESEKKPVVMNIRDDSMFIRVDSMLGNLNEEMEVEKSGPDIIIGLNPRFILDILRNIDDETVCLYMNDGKSPCMIKNDNEDFIYILMPININADAYR